MRKIWRLTVLAVALAAAVSGCARPADPAGPARPTVPVPPTTTVAAPPTTASPKPAPILIEQRFVRITNVIPRPGYAYRGNGPDTRVGPATLVLDDRSRLELVADATVVETCQLLLGDEQFAGPFLDVIEAIGLQIFRDMGVDKPEFALFRRSVGFGDLSLAQTQRFDLGAGQDNAGLQGIPDLIVKARTTVFSHEAVADPSVLVLVVLLLGHMA